MSVKRHTSLKGEQISLEALRRTLEAEIRWLSTEAAQARSWASFEERTARAVIDSAKRQCGDAWSEHDLFRLQKDLVGQVGVATNELRGTNTPSFGALLLEGVMALEGSVPQALFAAIAAASDVGVNVEEDELPAFMYAHRIHEMDPFDYIFAVDPPMLFSAQLDRDYRGLKDRGELAASSPIHVTIQGQARANHIWKKYGALLPGLKCLYQRVRVSSVEDLFSRSREAAFRAAL